MSIWIALIELGGLKITIKMKRTHEIEKEMTGRQLEKFGGR